jgi:hypothetical protein
MSVMPNHNVLGEFDFLAASIIVVGHVDGAVVLWLLALAVAESTLDVEAVSEEVTQLLSSIFSGQSVARRFGCKNDRRISHWWTTIIRREEKLVTNLLDCNF